MVKKCVPIVSAIVLLFAFLLLLYFFTSKSSTQESNANQMTLNRNKILIGSTLYYDNTGIVDSKHISEIKDAGIDFLITETKEDQDTLLNLAGKYNIGIIGAYKNFGFWAGTSNGQAETLAEQMQLQGSIIKNYVNHIARVGDSIFDEPNSDEFEALGKIYKSYHSNFPNKFLFINLFPAMATPEMYGENTYYDYVSKFADVVDSDYICFDSYPFYNNQTVEETYIESLNTVGSICREKGIDMWNYIQVQGGWYNYSLPNKMQIFWQVYSALAFGSKAIIHVSYTPVWGDGENVIGMVDKNGNKSVQWDYVKEVNANIDFITDTYMSYNYVDSFVIGDYSSSLLKNQLEKLGNIIQAETLSSDKAVLVGEFVEKSSNKKAFVLVNMQNPCDIDERAEVNFLYTDIDSISVYKNDNSVHTVKDLENYSLLLESGEGVFVTVNS